MSFSNGFGCDKLIIHLRTFQPGIASVRKGGSKLLDLNQILKFSGMAGIGKYNA